MQALPHDDASALAETRLFELHFDNLPLPSYIFKRDGPDFTLIAYNRAAGTLPFGKPSGLLGKTALWMQQGTAEDLHGKLHECAARRMPISYEVDHRYVGTDVERRLAVTLVPLSADVVVLHTDDVTERRRVEQALRESEAKYRTLVDTADEGIWTVDTAAMITYVNRRAAEILGYEPADLIGRSGFDLVHEDDLARARASRARRLAGAKEHFDIRLRHKDGSPVWVSVAVSPLRDHEGRVTGSIYMNSDITERKRMEQALQESERRVRALLDANPDLIVRVTRDGRYLDMHCPDPKIAQYLPAPPQDFIGRNVNDIFDPEFARLHEQYRLKALSTGELQRWEYVRPVRGSDRYIEARIVKSGDDEVVITTRDITQSVELERQVVASVERERARIGHDLHDGLAQLLTGVKLLMKALTDKLEAEGSKHTAEGRRATELISRAIGQTGELAQGLSPIRRGGRLSDALRQLAGVSEQLFGVRCRVRADELAVEPSEHTAAQLYRIAQEAISNAAKHGRATVIDIRCERRKQHLVLSVLDNGTGLVEMPPAGGGMGLHIMQYRARSIGGELSIAARPQGGTAVRCLLPLPAA
jgi:PAS domain S-box-containing protein